MKYLIYIVAYNAQDHISGVLERIPADYRNNPKYSILISDDCSSDATSKIAFETCKKLGFKHFNIFRTKVNQGYGGNQKIGYRYACDNNFDYVILLHADGQYPPEELPAFVAHSKNAPDVILGSRMLEKKNALRGGMPIYKFFSNILLTKIQNALTGTNYSEYHTGYRAYAISFLKAIPFELNSSDFDFDTDILLQAKILNKKITEFPIVPRYGDEICHVNLIKYGLNILKISLKFRLQILGIGCSLKFRGSKQFAYKKKGPFKYSTHHHLLDIISTKKPKRILDITAGIGPLTEPLKKQGIEITGIDRNDRQENYYDNFYKADIESFDWDKLTGKPYDMVCLLEILEHLKEPEDLLIKLKKHPLLDNALFIISIPNTAFFIIRINMLLGRFNYADRGILDIDHKRLFTYSSIHNVLLECGYKVNKTIPVPPPFELLGTNFISRKIKDLFHYLAIPLPGLFAFQVITIAYSIPVAIDVYMPYEDYSLNIRQ
ncbi:MAG: hypothetical protein DKM50_13905 [Candidatus Margulisiibacteriota bacterium]|nr:MAG: hypothetical protein DKM50_13905 [Candidatus Margulisiibacteriota bacterium]HCY35611.1 hypothetical protein [Candidatus Margulisiibacteriota bacterium]